MSNQRRITANETELTTIKSERDLLQRDQRDLQKYTRRNALRVYKQSWPEPRGNQEEPEDTDALMFKLAEDLDVPLAPWETGRSHRVGRPHNDGSPRPIIVKFISYNVRRRMYDDRKKLRDTPRLQGIYMNKDLTAENSKLAYDARQLRCNGQIYDTFTCDGRIYMRMNQGNRPKAIRDYDHLMSVVNVEGAHQEPRRQQPPPQSNVMAPTMGQSTTVQEVTNESTMSSSSMPLVPSPQAQNITFGIATYTSTPLPTSSDGVASQDGDGAQPLTGNEAGQGTNKEENEP